MRPGFFFFAVLFVLKTWAAPQDLIKSQAGCFDVAWDFIEDQVFIPNSPNISHPYHEKAMEWVTIDHDQPNRISLQHILLAGGELQKHWRQEWLFEQPVHLDYFGNQLWKSAVNNQVQGTWQRRVLQVDDSPRSDCFGTWNETDKAWSCTAWSPLPRRESKRHDYNVLARTNKHQITATGWILYEDNTKLLVDGNGIAKPIAHETGTNTYTRVDDSQCMDAQKWWSANQQAWEKVQDVWNDIRATHPVQHFVAPPGQGPLWMSLFEIVDGAVQNKSENSPQFTQDIRTAIHSYLK